MPREIVKYAEYTATEDFSQKPVGDELSICWGRAGELVQLRYQRRGEDPNIDQYVDLTRRDVNRMMRVLRNARDEAFGRDE